MAVGFAIKHTLLTKEILRAWPFDRMLPIIFYVLKIILNNRILEYYFQLIHCTHIHVAYGIVLFQTFKGNENWFKKLGSLRNQGQFNYTCTFTCIHTASGGSKYEWFIRHQDSIVF